MRTLTILSLVQWRTRKSWLYARAKRVPQLRLSGEWLRQAGFAEGDRVNVLTENGKLIIVKEVANVPGYTEAVAAAQ